MTPRERAARIVGLSARALRQARPMTVLVCVLPSPLRCNLFAPTGMLAIGRGVVRAFTRPINDDIEDRRHG